MSTKKTDESRFFGSRMTIKLSSGDQLFDPGDQVESQRYTDRNCDERPERADEVGRRGENRSNGRASRKSEIHFLFLFIF